MMRHQPNRVQPKMPKQAYISWEMRAPVGSSSDFWRAATCEEVDCPRWLNGFMAKIDESTELGRNQAAYLRQDRSRRCTESRSPEGLTLFTYPPGQTCFLADQHRVRTGRPPVYLVRGGDWRGTTSPPKVYDRPDQWVEDFATHQDKLSRAQQ